MLLLDVLPVLIIKATFMTRACNMFLRLLYKRGTPPLPREIHKLQLPWENMHLVHARDAVISLLCINEKQSWEALLCGEEWNGEEGHLQGKLGFFYPTRGKEAGGGNVSVGNNCKDNPWLSLLRTAKPQKCGGITGVFLVLLVLNGGALNHDL